METRRELKDINDGDQYDAGDDAGKPNFRFLKNREGRPDFDPRLLDPADGRPALDGRNVRQHELRRRAEGDVRDQAGFGSDAVGDVLQFFLAGFIELMDAGHFNANGGNRLVSENFCRGIDRRQDRRGLGQKIIGIIRRLDLDGGIHRLAFRVQHQFGGGRAVRFHGELRQRVLGDIEFLGVINADGLDEDAGPVRTLFPECAFGPVGFGRIGGKDRRIAKNLRFIGVRPLLRIGAGHRPQIQRAGFIADPMELGTNAIHIRIDFLSRFWIDSGKAFD